MYDSSISDLLLINLKFLLDLIFKSMVQLLYFHNKMNVSRKGRYSNQFKQNLEKLIQSVIEQLNYRSRQDDKKSKNHFIVQNAILNITRFLSNCLSVADRGFIFQLIQKLLQELESTCFTDTQYQLRNSQFTHQNLNHFQNDPTLSENIVLAADNLMGNEAISEETSKIFEKEKSETHHDMSFQKRITSSFGKSKNRLTRPSPALDGLSNNTSGTAALNFNQLNIIKLKFNIIEILCQHQNFIPLNFPVLDDKIKMNLDNEFMEQHFLIGIVLFHVKNSLKMNLQQDRIVDIFRNLILKTEIDDRFSGLVYRHKIFSLYLPFVKIFVEYVQNNFFTHPKSSNHQNSSNIGNMLNHSSLQAQNHNHRHIPNSYQNYSLILQDKLTTLHSNLYQIFYSIITHQNSTTLEKYYSNLNKMEFINFFNVLKFSTYLFRYHPENSNSIGTSETSNTGFINSSSPAQVTKELSYFIFKNCLLILTKFIKLSARNLPENEANLANLASHTSIFNKINDPEIFKMLLELIVNILKSRPCVDIYLMVLKFIRILSQLFGKSLLTIKLIKPILTQLRVSF